MQRLIFIVGITLFSHVTTAGQLTDALEREGIIAKTPASSASLRDQVLFRLEHNDDTVRAPTTINNTPAIGVPFYTPGGQQLRALDGNLLIAPDGTIYRRAAGGYVNT